MIAAEAVSHQPQPPRAALIADLEARIASAVHEARNHRLDPIGRCAAFQLAMEHLAALLQLDHGAMFGFRGGRCHVRLAGISAQSTAGIHGALTNWLAAARRKSGAAA